MKTIGLSLLCSIALTGIVRAEAPSKAIAPIPKSEDGQGAWKFKYVPELSKLPVDNSVLLKAHTSFGINKLVDNGERESYIGLPGVGLIRISADLAKVEVIGGKKLVDGKNLHNVHVFQLYDETRIAIPSDNGGTVFITDDEGVVVNELSAPPGLDPKVFKPTDAVYLDGKLFIANGYGDRRIYKADPIQGWLDGSWGGKPPFSTSHGLTVIPGTETLRVVDRENGRMIDYTKDGVQLGMTYVLEKADRDEKALKGEPAPCDVDYSDDGKFALVGCLRGPNGGNGVFYIMEKDKVVSAVCPADLGVANSRHIHNTAFRVVPQKDGTQKWYVLCMFWNPGGYAVFERL